MMNNKLDFLSLIGVDYPKYSIGDKVRIRHIEDDRHGDNYQYKLTISYGVIIGMKPDYLDKSWEYYILWDDNRYDYESFCNDIDFESVPIIPEFSLGDKVLYSINLVEIKPQLGIIKGIRTDDNGVSYQIFDIDDQGTLSYGDYLTNIPYIKKVVI